jgi:hypothetical protein
MPLLLFDQHHVYWKRFTVFPHYRSHIHQISLA